MRDTQPERLERCFLYSSDCPEGKIFEGADAIAAAEKDGWKDSPANLEAEETSATKNGKKGGKGATGGDNS